MSDAKRYERPQFWVEEDDGLRVRPAQLFEADVVMQNIDGRRVGRDVKDGVEVSTVFMVIDHSFNYDPNAAPVLYETMVFRGSTEETLGREQSQYTSRHHTRAEAWVWHTITCLEVLRRLPNKMRGPNVAKLIRPDGEIVVVRPSGVKWTLEELQTVVGGYVELIPTKLLAGPNPEYVLADEEGLLKGLPHNQVACRLTNHPGLVGNVLFVPKEEFDFV